MFILRFVNQKRNCCFIILLFILIAQGRLQSKDPAGRTFTNSLNMKFAKINAGEYKMGSRVRIPDHLTAPLSYPTRDDLISRFPHGNAEYFRVYNDHVAHGDFDEKPVHHVRIAKPFYMGIYEVTNEQFEQYDPTHQALRGRNGFSKADDEAAVFISWNEAKAFCDWLSKKEGLP